MQDEHQKINEAFENFLESHLSTEAQAKIAKQYGEAVATEVRRIYDDALRCPVDWSTATMETALTALHEFLSSKYSWLSSKARSNINYAFIMAWK